MAISRIPGGGTAAIFGAVGVALALGTLALIAPAQADPPAAAPMPAPPTAIMPPATPPAPTAVTPPHPAADPAGGASRPIGRSAFTAPTAIASDRSPAVGFAAHRNNARQTAGE